jgi:hypothetical protein
MAVNASTCNSGLANANRIAAVSSTPGSVSIMTRCGIFDSYWTDAGDFDAVEGLRHYTVGAVAGVVRRADYGG